MALTDKEQSEAKTIADKYVDAFVKCAGDGYDVAGNTIGTLDGATKMAFDRCSRVAGINIKREDDIRAADDLVRVCLKEAIRKLGCI